MDSGHIPGSATLPLDDVAIARRIAAGDRAAFDVLMRRNNRRLYRLARAALRDDAEAEEALQEVYLAAYRGIAGFRGDSALATWLSRLVLNECAERLRKGARRQSVAPMITGDGVEDVHDDEHERPDQLLLRAEMRALLERKVDALPKDFRIVFVLRSVEELSVEETADALGLDPGTVRTRHFRARRLLREGLAQEIDIAERDLFDFAGARCDRIVATVNTRLDVQVGTSATAVPSKPAEPQWRGRDEPDPTGNMGRARGAGERLRGWWRAR